MQQAARRALDRFMGMDSGEGVAPVQCTQPRPPVLDYGSLPWFLALCRRPSRPIPSNRNETIMRRFALILLAVVAACCTPRHPVPPPSVVAGAVAPVAPQQPPEEVMATLIGVLDMLSAAEPLPMPLEVRVCPIPGRWGQSRFDDATCTFKMELNSSITEPDFMASIVIHEWAHCLTQCKCEDPHCADWGINYARCYRAVFTPQPQTLQLSEDPDEDDPDADEPEEPEED